MTPKAEEVRSLMRPVYIQTKNDGSFTNGNSYAAWEGFTALGYEVKTFRADELTQLELAPDALVHGHVGIVWQALAQLGARVPQALGIPTDLEPFLGRRQWQSTLGEVRKLADVPVFIKPLENGKAFTGHIVAEFRDLIQTASLPDDFPVLVQEVVQLESEWRVFVLRGEVLGVGYYYGDPLRFPDGAVVKEMLRAHKDPVAAYGLDVGVTAGGQTLLVELNDGYALGCYGLPPTKYARLLEARWDELMSCKKVAST